MKIHSASILYPFAGNLVGAHTLVCFYHTYHTTTIEPNASRINNNTPHMVRFIQTISFGCETQSLIAVLTLYAGFHAFSTTTLTSSPPAKTTIYSTVHPEWGTHSRYLSAVGKGGCAL